MTEEKIPTIGELVTENYRTAPVFKKYGLDFCCKGGRTIADACAEKGIDPAPLLADLEKAADDRPDRADAATGWPLDHLAQHIVDTHHSYVREAIDQLLPFLDKVCRVHGDGHPELHKVREAFFASAQELTHHMHKEEMALFPFISELARAQREGRNPAPPMFGSVRNPIAMMKHEHETEGDRFALISELTNGYNPPSYACRTYQATYALLRDFEEDLHRHIHLENNILFPKSVALEQELLG
jgi:regulator of cell morphogenesis and NO signaling